jgi:hypothetical protein
VVCNFKPVRQSMISARAQKHRKYEYNKCSEVLEQRRILFCFIPNMLDNFGYCLINIPIVI